MKSCGLHLVLEKSEVAQYNKGDWSHLIFSNNSCYPCTHCISCCVLWPNHLEIMLHNFTNGTDKGNLGSCIHEC